LVKHNILVGIISLLVYAGASVGMMNYQSYTDQKAVWTPKDNPSIQNEARMKELFPLDS